MVTRGIANKVAQTAGAGVTLDYKTSVGDLSNVLVGADPIQRKAGVLDLLFFGPIHKGNF